MVTIRQGDQHRSPLAAASLDVSANGRYVAFQSYVGLVEADADRLPDIYVFDRITQKVTLETPAGDGEIAYNNPRISADGRFVVFESAGFGASRMLSQIGFRDRTASESRILSRGSLGEVGNESSRHPDISDNGQFVVFASSATNLAPSDDRNGHGEDVYLVEPLTGVVRRISLDADGVQRAVGESYAPRLNGDGSRVVFTSSADLTGASSEGPTIMPNGLLLRRVYVRDVRAESTFLVSAAVQGRRPDGSSWNGAISGDGRFVAFASEATNLMSGRRRGVASDIYLRDLVARVTTLISRTPEGDGSDGTSDTPSLSADGRFVLFQSDATNIACARRCSGAQSDINLLWDVFLYDRETGTMQRLSTDPDAEWMEPSVGPAFDGAGLVAAFSSRHPTSALDRSNDFDLFVRASPAREATISRRPAGQGQ